MSNRQFTILTVLSFAILGIVSYLLFQRDTETQQDYQYRKPGKLGTGKIVVVVTNSMDAARQNTPVQLQKFGNFPFTSPPVIVNATTDSVGKAEFNLSPDGFYILKVDALMQPGYILMQNDVTHNFKY